VDGMVVSDQPRKMPEAVLNDLPHVHINRRTHDVSPCQICSADDAVHQRPVRLLRRLHPDDVGENQASSFHPPRGRVDKEGGKPPLRNAVRNHFAGMQAFLPSKTQCRSIQRVKVVYPRRVQVKDDDLKNVLGGRRDGRPLRVSLPVVHTSDGTAGRCLRQAHSTVKGP